MAIHPTSKVNQMQLNPLLPSLPAQVLNQVGTPHLPRGSMAQKENGDMVFNSVAEHLKESVEWHNAYVKVFGFLQAQCNMNLFADDLKAQEIFRALLVKGIESLRHEASGGVIK